MPLLFACLLSFTVSKAEEPAQPGESAAPAGITTQAEAAQAGQATPTATAASESAHQPVEFEYSKKGADTCLKCHDEDSKYPVLDIFKTRHGVKADARTPFGSMQCESCHGPAVSNEMTAQGDYKSGGHVSKVRPGEERPPILNFGKKSKQPASMQNRMCMQCHRGDSHIGWQGSAHEVADVACANCHTVHTPNDPVLEKSTQAEVCFGCHIKQRAEFAKPSNHPVRFGELACSDCHTLHGAGTSTLLKRPTLNETCYSCHAEKRGPFLWEHAPASEDCSLCHTPHGSIHPALLKKRPPLLCQQCHSQFGHPSVSLTGSSLPGGAPSAFLLAGSCTNCHTQVHGSNHPSGVKLMR